VSEDRVWVPPPSKRPKKSLRELLDKYRGEGWAGKIVLMANMREYVRRQDPFILQDEVRDVSDEQDLNVLLGVGMRGFLYYEVIKQKAKSVGM